MRVPRVGGRKLLLFLLSVFLRRSHLRAEPEIWQTRLRYRRGQAPWGPCSNSWAACIVHRLSAVYSVINRGLWHERVDLRIATAFGGRRRCRWFDSLGGGSFLGCCSLWWGWEGLGLNGRLIWIQIIVCPEYITRSFSIDWLIFLVQVRIVNEKGF